MILDYIKESHPDLLPEYHATYNRNDRSYWEMLDAKMKGFTVKLGLDYVTNDDSMIRPFQAPPLLSIIFIISKLKRTQKRSPRRRKRSLEVIDMPELPEVEAVRRVIEPLPPNI